MGCSSSKDVDATATEPTVSFKLPFYHRFSRFISYDVFDRAFRAQNLKLPSKAERLRRTQVDSW